MSNNKPVENYILQPIPPFRPYPSPLHTPESATPRPRNRSTDLEAARTETRRAARTTSTTTTPPLGDTTDDPSGCTITEMIITMTPSLSFLVRLILLVCTARLHFSEQCAGTLFETCYHSLFQCFFLEIIQLIIAGIVIAIRTQGMPDGVERERIVDHAHAASSCVTVALWGSTIAAVVGAALRGVEACGSFL